MPNYIYALHCPIANTVRYVGKSASPLKRLKGHIRSAKALEYKHHTSAWIRKLLAEGLQPEISILEEIPDGQRWQEAERAWISKADSLGWKLTNSTAGGEGLDYLCPIAAAAYRTKMSEINKVVWGSPERREENRLKSLNAWADPEITSRRAATLAVTNADPEFRRRHAEVMSEVLSRPEVIEKMSQAAKARHPESKVLEVVKSPEFSAEQSARLKERWKDPAAREKLNASRWTEETKALQGQAVAARKEKMKASITPEVLARRNASIKASWDRRRAEKAAMLAAAPSAPYTESS